MSQLVQAWKIEPGTLIVLRDVEFDEDASRSFVDQLSAAAGHRKFLILHIYTGQEVRVVGPDEDMKAAVQALLADLAASEPA